MPNRMNKVDFGNEIAWAKFHKSVVSPTSGRVYYTFRCSIKPSLCQHKGEFYLIDLSERYRLNKFTLVSDEERKRIVALELGMKQIHPQKSPKTNNMCLGKLKGLPIDPKIIPMVMLYLGTYNEDDCFELPDAQRQRSLKEFYGGNQCQIF